MAPFIFSKLPFYTIIRTQLRIGGLICMRKWWTWSTVALVLFILSVPPGVVKRVYADGPTALAPIIHPVTTMEDVQSSPFMITKNPDDPQNVFYIKISEITGGHLYLNDGVTPIVNGQFIT